MPTLMPQDTRDALGANAEKCDSRSLLLDRFVYDHPDMDEARRLHFSQVCADSFGAIRKTREGWQAILNDPKEKPEAKAKTRGFLDDTEGLAKRAAVAGPALTEAQSRKISAKVQAHGQFVGWTRGRATLHAQLQSRLMVNMAGGVMENAGLCLDRFGLPYIPGSAVKGCARRAALAALHEWCAAGGQPEHKPTGPDNPLAACCAPFASPADMLAAIARVFGWCELDWSDRSDQSDFLWACADTTATLKTAAEALAAHFHWPIEDRHRDTPWLSLPNFAGNVSFLPAYPVDLGKTGRVDGLPLEVPTLGKLELDVVTCHHRDYYASDDPNAVATDTEEPVPVVFPAVAPGHVFTFALVPLRGADERLVEHARTWLKTGLETFGLGAKTNAGYGWFDASEAVQQAVQNALEEQARREREARERERSEQQRKAEEEKRLREKQEREAALANLSGDERADKEIELLTEQQFDAKVRAFCKDPRRGGPTEDQKKAMVRALRGPRLAYWQQFKTRATKGELAKVADAIRQLCKQMNLGKMP